MALRSIIISTVVTLIVLLGLFQFYERYHRPLTHRLNPDLQWLGLIDLNDAHEINLHGILNGEDAILVVDHATLLYQKLINKIPQANYLTPDDIFNLNNLHLFDKNGDGFITAKDPIFEHLYIIQFFNKGDQNDIKSLNASGIKAISIYANTPTGNRVVIMQDGSQRTLIGTNKLEKTPEPKP